MGSFGSPFVVKTGPFITLKSIDLFGARSALFCLRDFYVKKVLALSSIGAILVGSLVISQPASASTCPNATFFAASGTGVLTKYNSAGTLLGTVNLATDYYDIAFDSANGTFYGLRSSGQLDVINVNTGSVIRSVTPASVTNVWNAASVLPGGMIAVPFNNSSAVGWADTKLAYMNPTTGAVTANFNMNEIKDENGATYTRWRSAGDFITLQDGSLLALLYNENIAPIATTTIVVKITNGQGVILGKVPHQIFGAARVGEAIVLAGSDGVARKITSLPTTAGRGDIATTVFASITAAGAAGQFYSAAGTEDSFTSSCSPTGLTGFTAGVDAYATAVPTAPLIAGEVRVTPVVPEAVPTLASTGGDWSILPLTGFALLTLGFAARLSRRMWVRR
jgi:hypothetical protein